MDLKEAKALVEKHYPGKLTDRVSVTFTVTPELFGDACLTDEQVRQIHGIFRITPAQGLARLVETYPDAAITVQYSPDRLLPELTVTYTQTADPDFRSFYDAHGWTPYLNLPRPAAGAK